MIKLYERLKVVPSFLHHTIHSLSKWPQIDCNFGWSFNCSNLTQTQIWVSPMDSAIFYWLILFLCLKHWKSLSNIAKLSHSWIIDFVWKQKKNMSPSCLWFPSTICLCIRINIIFIIKMKTMELLYLLVTINNRYCWLIIDAKTIS